MNDAHDIYHLSEEQQAFLRGEHLELTDEQKAGKAKLEADVARLDGYLHGRADETARRLRQGIGNARGAGANKDLAG